MLVPRPSVFGASKYLINQVDSNLDRSVQQFALIEVLHCENLVFSLSAHLIRRFIFLLYTVSNWHITDKIKVCLAVLFYFNFNTHKKCSYLNSSIASQLLMFLKFIEHIICINIKYINNVKLSRFPQIITLKENDNLTFP